MMLGDTALMEPLTASIFDNEPLYLRVVFYDVVTGPQRLDPDQPIVSTAFAFKASDSDRLGGETGTYYLEWSNIMHMPGGFADSIDDDQPDDDSEVPASPSITAGCTHLPGPGE